MSSKSETSKENGLVVDSKEGAAAAAAVFTGPDYASSSKYIALTGDSGGYDDELYGGTSRYLRTEAAEDDEISMEGSSFRMSRTNKDLASSSHCKIGF